jgi:hypothetical protein
MAESKIIQALDKFKRDYSWDKSLISSPDLIPSFAAETTIEVYTGSYLDDFVRSQQAKAQQDHS